MPVSRWSFNVSAASCFEWQIHFLTQAGGVGSRLVENVEKRKYRGSSFSAFGYAYQILCSVEYMLNIKQRDANDVNLMTQSAKFKAIH